MSGNAHLANLSPDAKRDVLFVGFDVTGLTDKEIGMLTLECVVQGESSDGHPDVPVIGTNKIDMSVGFINLMVENWEAS